MLNISQNQEAMNLFLQIINTYGMFLKHREVVKSINENPKFSLLQSELSIHTVDPYSWQAREYGVMSGLTESNIQEIKEAATLDLAREKETLVPNLIKTEKYYKKLKHQFNERFPELKEEMQTALKDHMEYIENKKRLKHSLFTKIIGLSERFVAFYQYSFGQGQGLHLAYSSFSSSNIKKYNIEYNKEYLENTIERKFSYEKNSKACETKMNLQEIEFLNSILNGLVENVTTEDLEQVERYTESSKTDLHCRKTALHIIKNEFERFKKLNAEYKELIQAYSNI